MNEPEKSLQPSPWTYDLRATGNNGLCTAEDKCGPAYWGKIVPPVPTVINMCSQEHQSPVDIISSQAHVVRGVSPQTEDDKDTWHLMPSFGVVDGGCRDWTQYADDHTFEVSFSEEAPKPTCSNLNVEFPGGKKVFNLKQIHFHSPSEHAIDSVSAAGELHLVHKTQSGEVMVMAILLHTPTTADDDDDEPLKGGIGDGKTKGRSDSPFLNTFWQEATQRAKYMGLNVRNDDELATAAKDEWEVRAASSPINPYSLIKRKDNGQAPFYSYRGSLTTYPCTEDVHWLVFPEPAVISTRDLSILRKAETRHSMATIVDPVTKNNNRPTQPMNGRVVQYFPALEAVSVGGRGANNKAAEPVLRGIDLTDPSTILVIVPILLAVLLAAILLMRRSLQRKPLIPLVDMRRGVRGETGDATEGTPLWQANRSNQSSVALSVGLVEIGMPSHYGSISTPLTTPYTPQPNSTVPSSSSSSSSSSAVATSAASAAMQPQPLPATHGLSALFSSFVSSLRSTGNAPNPPPSAAQGRGEGSSRSSLTADR